jgi:hypothetical protein
MMRFQLLSLILLVVIASGCGGLSQSTATPVVNTATPVAELTPTTTAMPAPTVETPTPMATATPISVRTWSSISPDGKWIAQRVMEGPFLAGDEEKYHYQLKVVNTNRTIGWTAVDDTSQFGLGYTTPQPFHWSKDGRYLYFTNEPVPDGCAVFVNGSDLQRVDLETGRVKEMLAPGAWWLSLSPDEEQLAYIYWNGKALEIVIRNLATEAERRTKLEGAGDDSQAGGIVWSPDGKAFVLTVATHPCDPENWIHSIVWVDRVTLSQKVLIHEDKRLFSIVEWSQPGKVLLKDKDGNSRWMDVVTGQMTRAK